MIRMAMELLKWKRICCILMVFMALLSSCGSRKNLSNTTASRAAGAMAKLTNKKLYKFITDWVGVKYKFGGLNKQGIDCSGFTYLLEKEIYGKNLPRRSKDQALAINRRSLANLKEGDLIFFSFGGNEVDHVGVYLNSGFFVHASTKRGVVVDDLSIPAYQQAIVKMGTLN